jgi:hypothetical protein
LIKQKFGEIKMKTIILVICATFFSSVLYADTSESLKKEVFSYLKAHVITIESIQDQETANVALEDLKKILDNSDNLKLKLLKENTVISQIQSDLKKDPKYLKTMSTFYSKIYKKIKQIRKMDPKLAYLVGPYVQNYHIWSCKTSDSVKKDIYTFMIKQVALIESVEDEESAKLAAKKLKDIPNEAMQFRITLRRKGFKIQQALFDLSNDSKYSKIMSSLLSKIQTKIKELKERDPKALGLIEPSVRNYYDWIYSC